MADGGLPVSVLLWQAATSLKRLDIIISSALQFVYSDTYVVHWTALKLKRTRRADSKVDPGCLILKPLV